MRADIGIYYTPQELILQLGSGVPVDWYTIGAVADGDAETAQLYGVELTLKDAPEIGLLAVSGPFAGYKNVAMILGFMYVQLRAGQLLHPGFGFSRQARVSVDAAGHLAVLRVPWADATAATPSVDPQRARAGLPTQVVESWDALVTGADRVNK